MVGQVKTVAILMIVQGSLGCLAGLCEAGMGPVIFAAVALDKPNQPAPKDEVLMAVLTVVFIVFGGLSLMAGILNIVAGIRSLKFRGRVLAIVALFSNLAFLAISPVLCAPTSIGLMVYGLIVMFNSDVARAFERGRWRHHDDYYQ